MNPTIAREESHPRGTLAIIALYALLFLAGWAALYFLMYLKRGPVGP